MFDNEGDGNGFRADGKKDEAALGDAGDGIVEDDADEICVEALACGCCWWCGWCTCLGCGPGSILCVAGGSAFLFFSFGGTSIRFSLQIQRLRRRKHNVGEKREEKYEGKYSRKIDNRYKDSIDGNIPKLRMHAVRNNPT